LLLYVTGTLTELTWSNSHRITGDLVDEVAKLRAQPGGYLLILGSADLARLLTRHNLVNEYYLSMAPIVLGQGKRLFQEGDQARLHPVSAKIYASGMVRLGFETTKP
jgi:dihydrofolate reductase